MEDLFGPPVPQQAALETVVAVFDFEAQEDTDLGFKKGDKIEVIKRDGDWWTGRIGSREGTFPFNYVKKPETMDSSDPLAQAFQVSADTNLLEKVTGSDGPVDLQKMLGKEEESVLEQEARLQNERIANSAGLVQNESLFDEPAKEQSTNSLDMFSVGNSSTTPAGDTASNSLDSFMDLGNNNSTSGGLDFMSQPAATNPVTTSADISLSFDNFGSNNLGFSSEEQKESVVVTEEKPAVSTSDSKPDLGFGGFDSLGMSPRPQTLPEPVAQTEEESTPNDSASKSIAPSIPETPPAVIPSTPNDKAFAAEPIKMETPVQSSLSANPEPAAIQPEPINLQTESASLTTPTTPTVTSSAAPIIPAAPTPAPVSPPVSIAPTPAVIKPATPPVISNPSVTIATAVSASVTQPSDVSPKPISLTATEQTTKPQAPSITPTVSVAPAAPKPAVVQPSVPTAEPIQAAVAPATKSIQKSPAKTAPKAPAAQSSSGVVKTAAKTAKIADELGLEFDDGGSTEIVTFEAKPKEYIEMVVNSLPARVFVAIMVIMDIILTIMDLAKQTKTTPDQAAFDWISFLTGLIFVFDVAGRMYAYGFERYFSDPWEAADFGIVCVTFSVSVAMLALDADADTGSATWLKIVTFLRVLRIFRLVRLLSSGTGAARQQVGQNKRRYQKDGFDLDLTYITDQCIAMSFPSEGRTAMFRNPMNEVSRFMKTKHPGHYYVWNLCAERGYESHWFEQRCGRLLVDDHNVPKLKELVDWADQVKVYTAESKENVLVVHCKGGKGRTGTCIATWMLATDFLKTADLALRHFGERRTDDRKGKAFQGVETPSQSRYVNYYEKIKYNGWPVVRKIEIKAFTIQNISPIGRGNGSCIFFKIFNYGKEVFFGNVADQHNVTCAVDRQLDRATIHLKTPLVVKDDIKFMFYSSEKSVPRNYEDCGFYFWLHTGFFPASGNLTLGRHELDNPHKSKTWSTFTDGFSCTVHFSIVN